MIGIVVLYPALKECRCWLYDCDFCAVQLFCNL